jgi:hypothetical protein
MGTASKADSRPCVLASLKEKNLNESRGRQVSAAATLRAIVSQLLSPRTISERAQYQPSEIARHVFVPTDSFALLGNSTNDYALPEINK